MLGVWILLPMQSNWDFWLSHRLGPELHLLGDAGRSVESPVRFVLAKALSQEAVLQKFSSRMDLAISAFELPVAHELL